MTTAELKAEARQIQHELLTQPMTREEADAKRAQLRAVEADLEFTAALAAYEAAPIDTF